MLTVDQLPSTIGIKHLCGYFNTTQKVQVVRISNISNWYLEHVVFPREHFLFEAPPDAELEIYQDSSEGAMLLEKRLCYALQIEDDSQLKAVS